MNTITRGTSPRFDCFTRPIIVCSRALYSRPLGSLPDLATWRHPGHLRKPERTLNCLVKQSTSGLVPKRNGVLATPWMVLAKGRLQIIRWR